MSQTFALVTAPAIEPVTLARAKNHLRVDVPDDDQYIQDLISGAREQLENAYEQAFITQTWDIFMDRFPASWPFLPAAPIWTTGWPLASRWIDIARQPVAAITSVRYTDSGGTLQTMPTTDWFGDVPGARVGLNFGKVWPAVPLRPLNGVQLRVDLGYGATAALTPFSVRQAILLLIGHYYLNREQVLLEQRIRPIDLPRGVQDLMNPLDWRSFAA